MSALKIGDKVFRLKHPITLPCIAQKQLLFWLGAAKVTLLLFATESGVAFALLLPDTLESSTLGKEELNVEKDIL